jgi:ubiquitin-conjugating enzyme E2 W
MVDPKQCIMRSQILLLTIFGLSAFVECRWNELPIRFKQINPWWRIDARRKVSPFSYKCLREISLESIDDRIAFQAPLSRLCIPRGGAKAEDRNIEIKQNDDSDSVFLRKIRNAIRSVTLMTKNASPVVHQSWVSFIRFVELATGVQLMPEKKSIKKKGKSKSTQKEPDIIVGEEKSITTLKSKKSTPTTKASGATGSGKISKGSSTASLQLKKDLKATNPNYRIQQELKKFILDPPEHLSVKTGKNIRIWIVTMQGIGIYKGETFRLRIQFPNQYPTVPPSVYFLPPNIPVHEHVYTNGDICLSLLGKDWRPTMTAQSVAHSILSILASASSKSLPMDNARHAGNSPGQYQENWVYHDDNC